MNKLAVTFTAVFAIAALAACGKQESTPAASQSASDAIHVETPAVATVPDDAADATQAEVAGGEPISETADAAPAADKQASTVQPSVRLGNQASTPMASLRFKEGANYQRVVPAQPTSAAPDEVEVIEVFWYGCGHCFALDPAIESWSAKSKPGYVEFLRVPAMWNDMTRMHARMFYTAELLGKLEPLHTQIFREIHVNGNQLTSADRIGEFFQQHGVSAEEFKNAFSSFAVESKLQRADFLNRRFRVQSVPMFVVNGKYTTDVSSAGDEQRLFQLIDELVVHEHGN